MSQTHFYFWVKPLEFVKVVSYMVLGCTQTEALRFSQNTIQYFIF